MERSINFTGLVQHNEMTKALGISVAKMLKMHMVNYNFALPGLAGSADAQKVLDPQYAQGIERAGTKSEINDPTSGDLARFGTPYGTSYNDLKGSDKGVDLTGHNTTID